VSSLVTVSFARMTVLHGVSLSCNWYDLKSLVQPGLQVPFFCFVVYVLVHVWGLLTQNKDSFALLYINIIC
jgi:hypothetical protein